MTAETEIITRLFSDGPLPLIALLFLFVGLYGLFRGFQRYRRYQLIRDTPTSTVQSLSVGTVELNGTVKQQQEEHLYENPLTEEDCVYYDRVVEPNTNNNTASNVDEQVGDEFYLDDGTGSVRVRLADANFDIEGEASQSAIIRHDSNDDIPKALGEPHALDTNGRWSLPITRFAYRVEVESLKPGMDVYVFGEARRTDDGEPAARNKKNVVVGNPTETGLASPELFMIANQDEDALISERKWLGSISVLAGLILSTLCFGYLVSLIVV